MSSLFGEGHIAELTSVPFAVYVVAPRVKTPSAVPVDYKHFKLVCCWHLDIFMKKGMYFFICLLFGSLTHVRSATLSHDVQKNVLRFPYGVNFKIQWDAPS